MEITHSARYTSAGNIPLLIARRETETTYEEWTYEAEPFGAHIALTLLRYEGWRDNGESEPERLREVPGFDDEAQEQVRVAYGLLMRQPMKEVA